MYNNKRSKNSELRRKQKYEAKRFVFETSWKDRIITEVIEQSTPEMVDNHIYSTLLIDEPQVYFAQTDWQDGLVLVSALTFAVYQNMQLTPSQPTWALTEESEDEMNE